MQKTHLAVAEHLAHSKPTPLPPGSEMIPMRVHKAKEEQWELDVLVVMDALAMGGKPLDRGEFLRKVGQQFEEDERTRRGDPPADV